MIVTETGFTGTAVSLSYPRIGAYPIAGTVTPSTEATGFEAVNAQDGQTWTFWKPTAVPATWDLAFSSAAVSYVGIAAHNIGSTGGTIAVFEWTGAAFVSIKTHTPTDDSPIMFLLTRRTAQTQFRIRITNAIPTIGVIYIGDVLEFPSKAEFTGSLPFAEATQSTYSDTLSDGGHVLERFEIRKAAPVSMEVRNLSETWVATNLVPLAVQMRDNPVFIADRPGDYPTSVAFGLSRNPVMAERTLAMAGASRSVTFDINGFVA